MVAPRILTIQPSSQSSTAAVAVTGSCSSSSAVRPHPVGYDAASMHARWRPVPASNTVCRMRPCLSLKHPHEAPRAPPQIMGVHPSYGGSCTLCGGSHELPCTAEAVAAMQALLNAICQHQRLDFDSSTPADPRFALDYLFTKGPGRMLGVMLATDEAGQQHILRAFSGQITECWYIPGWVGPVAGVINESPVYVRTRKVIDGMSARLSRLEKQQQQCGHQEHKQLAAAGTSHHKPPKRGHRQLTTFAEQQRQLLKRRRRCLSHHLLQQIQHSYVTCTVGAVQQLSLLEVYASYRQAYEPDLPVTRAGQQFVGMPAGVGDCCAPKLLHAAAQQGLTPYAMCEVWFGSAPGTTTKAKQGRVLPVDADSSRQHCRLYGPCDKCRAILGSMLCNVLTPAGSGGGVSIFHLTDV